MKTLIMLLALSSLTGCIEEENCYPTNEIDYYKTKETIYYTITVPVYKMRCE